MICQKFSFFKYLIFFERKSYREKESDKDKARVYTYINMDIDIEIKRERCLTFGLVPK